VTFVNPYEATGQAGFTVFGWFLDLGGAGGFVSSCVKCSWEGGRSQTLPDQWMWFWCMLGLEHLWCCTYQDQMNIHLALPLQRDEQDGKKATFQSKEERALKHVIWGVPNKPLFVWFWSPNLMDFLMARLLKHQPNQINHSRLNFFSAARCTPCFWCNMISRCGLCLWTRLPHVGIRWEVILGFPGSFFTNDIPQKRWFCKVIWSGGNGTGMWSSWLWLGEYFKLKHLRVANGFWD